MIEKILVVFSKHFFYFSFTLLWLKIIQQIGMFQCILCKYDD